MNSQDLIDTDVISLTFYQTFIKELKQIKIYGLYHKFCLFFLPEENQKSQITCLAVPVKQLLVK